MIAQLITDPVAWVIAGCFPAAVLQLKGLGASWRQAFAFTAIVYAAAIGAGAGLSLIH